MTQVLQNRYAVDKLFADSGGMGVIYAARDLKCRENRVLIKTTRYDGGQNARHFKYTTDEAVKHIEKMRKIIEWEKKILVRFKNDNLNNIPSINDFFHDRSILLEKSYQGRLAPFEIPDSVLDSEPFLVMERIHGKPLNKLLRDPAFRDENLERRLLQMAKELLTIFIKLHRKVPIGKGQGYFIYQDLKPANILVSPGDYFTLIDMGGVTLRLAETTTEPTAGCITAGYAAPEADNDRSAYIDQRFDIYTLGVTLWEAFTGKDPQELGGEFPQIPLDMLSHLGLRHGTLKIITRALERDPNRRYASAAAMRKDVIHALNEARKQRRTILH